MKHAETRDQAGKLPRRRNAGGVVPLDVAREHDPEHQENRDGPDVDQDLKRGQKLGFQQHKLAGDREEKRDQNSPAWTRLRQNRPRALQPAQTRRSP